MSDLITTPVKTLDLSPQTFDQAWTLSQMLANSSMVPKDYQGKAENCMIAMQWGNEIGLKPLQAIQNIAVINGRPSMWGDSVIALVLGSPLCEGVTETDDGHTATCTVKRRGQAAQTRTFSMDDAALAGLKGKSGPWTTSPKRMRQMRARSFALRDVFADVLRGMAVAEEAMDMPPVEIALGEAVQVKTSAPAVASKPAMPDTVLDKHAKTIQESTKTPEEIIAGYETKYALNEQQKAEIHAMKTPVIDTEITAAYQAAELASE